MLAAVMLAAVCAGPALAGASFGIHGGWSDLGGDVFRGSGKIGNVNFLGLQANLPIASLVSLGLAGESRHDSLHFRAAGNPGALFSGRGRWDDVSLYASLRVNLFPVKAGPFSVYAGGGAGVHLTKIKLVAAAAQQAGVADFVHETQKDKTDLSLHALGGASFGLPVFPLSLFAETRLERVSGNFKPHGISIYGGVNLELP